MPKTIQQILIKIHEVKPCSKRQAQRHLETLNIQPLGARQRPQLYPDDSAARILAHLGFSAPDAGIISVNEAKRRAAAKGGRK